MKAQTFRMTLTAQGPVSIGDGKTISKKEYHLFPEKHLFVVMDMSKLYRLACEKGLRASFEDFLYQQDTTRADGLKEWIDKNTAIKGKALNVCVRYVLPTGAINDEDEQGGQENSNHRNDRPKRASRGKDPGDRQKTLTIGTFIKDPYGKPYVPGSSIKGMLRTVLLTARLWQNRRAWQAEIDALKSGRGNRNNYLKGEIDALEARAFHTLGRPDIRREDAVNDELSGLIVGDSEPLTLKDLILCQRLERKPDGKEKTLPILKESLRSGTRIRFSLTIDPSRCVLTKEALLEAVERFDEVYQECFLSAFSGMDRLTGSEVYLGGNAGFATKTVIYAALGRQAGIQTIRQIFRQTKVPRNHHHERDQKVSPHIVKCARYQGKLYEFGKCRLAIE